MFTIVTDEEPTPAGTTSEAAPAATTGGSLIDEIVRDGARRMLATALETEVAACIAAHAGELDERGRRLVARNGHAEPRQVGDAPPVARRPRVRDAQVPGPGARNVHCGQLNGAGTAGDGTPVGAYNPTVYRVGTVWPFDNSVIAWVWGASSQFRLSRVE